MSDIICTGSHMNHRTFKEDDYWSSFQSTIVSGQVMSAEASTSKSDAEEMTTSSEQETTVDELSTLVDEATEENLLNVNLDAISDLKLELLDEDFVDCPSFEKSPANLVRTNPRSNNVVIVSPRPYVRPQTLAVQFTSPPDTNNNSSNINCLASPRKQRPESARRISPILQSRLTSMASESSSSSTNMKTGSLLVQVIDDFNDLQYHAQSTPKFSSFDSGNPSSGPLSDISSFDQVRKTLFQNAETMVLPPKSAQDQDVEVNMSDKENFFDGKYTNFVAARKTVGKSSPTKVHSRSGKVALLKEFFQSRVNESKRCKSLYKSRIPLRVKTSQQQPSPRVKKSPQAKSRASGSPRYQTRKTYQLVSSRSSNVSKATASTFSSTGTESFSTLSQRKSRVHSCSDAANVSKAHPSTATTFSSSGTESFLTRNQRKSRVQSCSDATNVELMSIDETNKSHSTGDLPTGSSIKALNSSKITKRTYLKVGETSQPKTVSPKKVSAIHKRRSVGLEMKKKNTSPVKPVCEIRKMFTPSKRAGNAKEKQAAQKSLVLPKIVISHQ